jgi:hypothetical protein
MINKSNNVGKNNPNTIMKKSDSKKPDETGGIYFSSHVKIFDPNTKQVLLKKRGDE